LFRRSKNRNVHKNKKKIIRNTKEKSKITLKNKKENKTSEWKDTRPR